MNQYGDNILRVTWQGQMPEELLTQTGEWLESRGDAQKALSFYDAATILNPGCSLAAFRGGQLSLKMKRCEEALQRFTAALRVTPDHAPTHYLASKAYLCLQRIKDALSEAEETLRYDPNHVGAFLVRLRCLINLQQWNEIRSLYTRESHRFVGSEAILMLVLALCHLGEIVQAQGLYDAVSLSHRRRFSTLTSSIELFLTDRNK
jgi:tetratricopeptide (TPR) repeat protein